MERCALCRLPASKLNGMSTHHIQGRKKNIQTPTMRVHAGACHRFSDFITTLYKETGKLEELTENIIVYHFTRMTTLRGGAFVLPR